MKMTLLEAYEAWIRWRPEDREPCCSAGHFHNTGMKRWDPKPDAKVCERELAWRRVVRIRDGDLKWPFWPRVSEVLDLEE